MRRRGGGRGGGMERERKGRRERNRESEREGRREREYLTEFNFIPFISQLHLMPC